MTTKIRILSTLILVVGALAEGPRVKIANGELEGTVIENIAHAYQGIPFAEPPKRLEYPVKKQNWEGVRDAKTIPPRCLQEVKSWSKYVVSEDCLFLSVIAPPKTDATHPVLVIVNGGAFSTGGISETNITYVSRHLVNKSVVVVAIQYRTGPLGFCTTGDGVIPGNYGVFDVKMALEWVRDNIAAFGGKPDEVTLYGGSAGAAMIDVLQLNDETSKLFHKMFIWSGVARDLFTYDIKGSCKKFLEKKGLDVSTKEKMRESIINAKNTESLASGWHVVTEDAIKYFTLDWSPVWDGVLFEGDQKTRLKELRKNAPKKPMVIGMAELEGAGFTGRFTINKTEEWRSALRDLLHWIVPGQNETMIRELQTEYDNYTAGRVSDDNEKVKIWKRSKISFQKAFGELIMTSVVYDEIDYYRKKNGDDKKYPVYLYTFKHFNATLTEPFFAGAFHSMDQWYGIGSNAKADYFDGGSADTRIRDMYTGFMVNFTRTSNPNTGIPNDTPLNQNWEPVTMTRGSRNFQIASQNSTMEEEYFNGRPECIRDWSRELNRTKDL